jgi:hypothetical protein
VGLSLAGIESLPEQLRPPSWVVLAGPARQCLAGGAPPARWLAARQWLARVVAPVLPETHTPHRLLTVCSGALLAGLTPACWRTAP